MILKTVKVVPILKKGFKLDCCNYRPISLLSNVEKILEKLIYKRVYNFLTENNFIYDLQFAFRQTFSTSHFLINLTENIREALDEGYIGCGAFMDLKNVFETVDHEILLSKLDHYGIRSISYNWFKSYLSNRKQFVSINGYDSGLAEINCGLLQGPVLEPLLFLLYINDLNQTIKFCKVYHFADDAWNLTWKSHIDYLSVKLSRTNALLFKIRNLVNSCILRTIYFAIFGPHLNYCSLLWSQN